MIGYFGGTFDPVHFGHLRTALEVREKLGLESVALMPCGEPPHREQPLAMAEQRLHMLHLAVDGVEGFQVDDREVHRSGPSYMVDTLHSLYEEGAEAPCLIIGMDAFLGLESWKAWQEILQLSRLVVMHRPESDPQSVSQSVALASEVRQRQCDWHTINTARAGSLCFVPVIQLAISASDIRSRLSEGRDIRYLLPEAVRQFILEEKLYE